MSKKCDLTIEQLGQIEKFIDNKVTSITDPSQRQEAILKLLTQMDNKVPGTIEQYNAYLAEKTKNSTLNPQEAAELNDLLDKGLKDGPMSSNLTATENARLFVLAEKAQNTTGGNPMLLIRAKEYLKIRTEEKPVLTISAIELLEKQRDIAERNGDLQMVARVDKLLQSMERATKAAESMKINWSAIEKVQNKREQILAELALLQAVKSSGDGVIVMGIQANEKTITKLLEKIKELRNLKRKIQTNDDSEEDKEEQLKDLDVEIKTVTEKINKLRGKILKKQDSKSRKRMDKINARIKTLELELKKIEIEGNDLSFVETLIYSSTPDKSWYVASARDLLQKSKKVRDTIKFVKTTIESVSEDYGFTRRELETLLGKDPLLLPQIRARFSNIKDDPTSKDQTFDEKKTITKEEALELFSLWSALQEESVFDPGYDEEESKIISDMVKFTDRELITDVDPESPQPVSYTKEQAASTVRGYTYDGNSRNDRIRLITDLQKTLGRLNTIARLPRFNGVIPEWALVSALGTDAQSLFSLFDTSVINPQALFYDDDNNPLRFSDDHQRRTFLENMLYNYGFNEGTFATTPENNEDFKSDFRQLIGTTFAKNAQGQIIAIFQTSRVQGTGKEIITETFDPIYSSNGKGQPLTQDDVKKALSLFEEQMNSGFKMVTHNAFHPDGVLQQLAEQSKDAKLTFRVAVRLFDTGMMGIRSSRNNAFSRHRPPSLRSLANSLLKTATPLASETEIQQQIDKNDVEGYERNLSIESNAILDTLLAMQANQNKEITVQDDLGEEKQLYFSSVSALWMDGTGDLKGMDFNPHYRGIVELFDVEVFNNLRNFRGESAGQITMYDLAKVQDIAMNLMFVAMEELNPSELNNILTGLVATPKQMDRHYELSMRLSQKFHEGYIEKRREQRSNNDNQFILQDVQDTDGSVKQTLSTSAEAYVTRVISEIRETLKAYKRSYKATVETFATQVGFRQQEPSEKDDIYLSALFTFANQTFNKQSYSFIDYGNGNFDYISAQQLGRGFAQIMLGFVREGNTLTQNIDIPLDAARQLKEDRSSEQQTLNPEDLESNIEERQYLPLTRTNVSFFSPLSMYEQERTYSDWALRKRYKHILSKTLTDEDRKRFAEFVKTNKIVEFRNKITDLKTKISAIKVELKKTPKSNELKTNLQTLEKELKSTKEAYGSYMESLDDRRLEQGRVQTYRLLNPVNNADLFTRVPTMDEATQMSLEVAFELPQLIATYVHDSRNYIEGSKTHLERETYMADPGKSAGGPGAQSTWAGVHPLLGFMVMYPQRYRPTNDEIKSMIREAESLGDANTVKRLKDMLSNKDKYGFIDITPEIIKQSLLEGYKARKEGVKYSKSTYFDDKFSGIHHLIAAQEAYMPSSRAKSLLNELIMLRDGTTTVSADKLDDYYEKTFKFTVEHAERLRDRIKNSKWNPQQKQEKLKQLERVLFILQRNVISTDGETGPTKSARDFFKGVVIPVIYSGGAQAVYSDLRNRRKKAIRTNDPTNPDIGDLTDGEIEVLSHVLAAGATNAKGRLIDEIIDMNPEAASKLTGILTGDTERLISNYRLDMTQLIGRNPDIADGFVNHELLRGAIDARIRYVAELSINPQDVALRFESRSSEEMGLDKDAIRNLLVEEKAKQLRTKWKDRIDKAMKRIEEYHAERGSSNTAAGFELGSELEYEINVILAGGEKQYRTQASLLFLNKVQNSGYNMNATNDALLEHRVKTGRYIAPDDIMFQNYTVFMSAAFGTSTGRMQYPGNYLTNLQGASLSKGFRLVYNEDGSLNTDDTVLGSMWKLTENPLATMSREDALQHAQDLAIKNYSLMLATDYDPEFLGYNAETEEDRKLFFDDWYDRSETERTFTHQVRQGGAAREAYKQLYQNQQRMIYRAEKDEMGNPKFTDEQIETMVESITDKDIDDEIDSNSVSLDKRETIRILAPDVLASDSGTMMTMKDAKGLGAFIPRIADHDAKDHIVHGLYTIHHGNRRARLKAGRNLLQINRIKREKPTLKSILERETTELPRQSSIYDPDKVPYIPVTADSLPEMLLDHEPSIMVKVSAMQSTLDTFAINNGYEEWVKEKNYAHLYQIYQIHLKLRKLSSRLHRMDPETIQAKELKMEFRNLILNLFKMTKFQRDAKKSERSILDFRKSVSIDPTKFQYKDGTNMRYLDVLKTLGKLGIEELFTLQFGIVPTELHVLGDVPGDVLKEVSTIVKPFYVQGHDVALLIMEVLANDVVKRRATEIVKQMEKNGKLTYKPGYDKQGFVILSDLDESVIDTILAEVMQDDALVDSAANNLNLYVTLEWGMNSTASNPDGEPRAKITAHKPSPSVMVTPRRGLGDAVVNRTRIGPRQAQFMMTAEAIKRILTGARNHGLLTKVHVALQTNKFLGTRTNVDTLRSESFREFGEDLKQQVAEESEILERLIGPDPKDHVALRRLVTEGISELKDEHGLTLNPYDAEYYFYDDGSPTVTNPEGIPYYRNMTPFKAAISSRIRKALSKGKVFPTLKDDITTLETFLNGGNNDFVPVSFLIYLKSTVKDLGLDNYKILVEEVMGVESITDEQFKEINDKADTLLGIIDKIEFSPTKGKNPYLSLALREQERIDELNRSSVGRGAELSINVIPDINNPNYQVRAGRNFKVIASPPSTLSFTKDAELKAQAVREARELRQYSSALEIPAYPTNNQFNIMAVAYDPSNMEAMLPADAHHIDMQINQLVADGTITEDVAVFYRYMIMNVFKTNPELAPLLSITSVNTSSNVAGSAIKQEDKFIIKLNTNVLKNMGTVDQIRIFAHEMAHIARMAFIRDNSKEWNNLLSIFRSPKGKATIETMLLAMNNGKKYIGFDEDVRHYLSHPEEFAAQWGGWVLFQKTFNSVELLKFLQSRNRGAAKANQIWKAAVFAVSKEVVGISNGLNELDEKLRNNILDVVENMFGFTATEHRRVFIENANNELFMIDNLQESISRAEELRLEILESMGVRSRADDEEMQKLTKKYEVYGVFGISKPKYRELRTDREMGTEPFDLENSTNEQQLEAIQTVVQVGMQRAAKNARANHTFGGLSRNLAEKIFGVETANKIIKARHAMVLGTSTKYTVDSSNPIIATLMNIIGDTLSMHSYQFQTTEGSQSIIPNRMNTRILIERVSMETNNLFLECRNKKEFMAMQHWAVKTAMGITLAPPASSPEVLKAATQLAQALEINSKDLSRYIYDSFADRKEILPLQWDKELLGTGTPKTLSGASSSSAKAKQASRRELLQKELTSMIQARLEKGEGIDATVLYVMNIMPRNITLESVQEWMLQNPAVAASLETALVDKTSLELGITDSEARSLVRIALRQNFVMRSSTPGIAGDRATTDQMLRILRMVVDDVYNSASVGNIGAQGRNVLLAIQDSVRNQLNNKVNTISELSSETRQATVNSNVIRISSVSAFSNTDLSGNPSEVLAKLLMGHVGNSAVYLNKASFMPLSEILKNSVTAELIDPGIHKGMYQIERTQGYMKTSEKSIYRITGLKGVNILQLIQMIQNQINNIKFPNDRERENFKKSLVILVEKLKVDQGLGIRDVGGSEHPTFEFMAKWGPDIVRMMHGNNLNTASLLVEGGMGLVVSQMYGGNPFAFVGTIFSTMFNSYFGRNIIARNMTQIDQRGAAVNLLLGVERMVQDAREVMHISDTTFDRNAGKIQKLRDWIRQSNNRGLMSVQAGLYEQGQWIFKKNLSNGNIAKLKDIVENGYTDPITRTNKKITSLDDLAQAMTVVGISKRKLKPHMAMMIIQSGILDTEALNAYRHMTTVVDNTNTGKWGLDLQAAGRWIETTSWASGYVLTATGTRVFKTGARKAIASIYRLNKEFASIVTVDPNSFDSATATNAMMAMFFFYRQYPNLFLSQKMFRLAGRMDKRTWAAMMISSAILDVIYNLLLMVATGFLPLTALLPWHKDWIGNEKVAMLTAKLFITRNPIFSPTGNLLAEAVARGVEKGSSIKENKYQNSYNKIKQGTSTAVDELMPDFMGLQATKTFLNTLVPTAVLGTESMYDLMFYDGVGGKINEQEHWDLIDGILKIGTRMTPFVELPIRTLMPTIMEETMGQRPVKLPNKPFGYSSFAQPNRPLQPRGLKPNVQLNPKPPTLRAPVKPEIPTLRPEESLRQQGTTPYKAPR